MTAPFGEEQQLQNWHHEPLEQAAREKIKSLLTEAHARLPKTASESIIEEDVIVKSKKKFFALRGYSHHIDWENHRILRLIKKYQVYGLTDTAQLVAHTGLIGPKDEKGRNIVYIAFGGMGYPPSDTWQIIDIDTIPSEDLPDLHAALVSYLAA